MKHGNETSDEHLVLQLYLEELKLAKQQEDDASLALALQLSENAQGASNSFDPDTTTSDTAGIHVRGGADSAPDAMSMSGLARSLLSDDDRTVALREALENARAAEMCEVDNECAIMVGRYEQVKRSLNHLDRK